MNNRSTYIGVTLQVCAAIGMCGCGKASNGQRPLNPVVGTWLVKDPNAPFPYHLYVFNGDGTMQQANPDAGDAHTSDSDGKGVWAAAGDRIRGKWVEVLAERSSHQFAGRLEITYDIKVSGNTYAGTEAVHSYDAMGNETAAPRTPAPIEARRITYP